MDYMNFEEFLDETWDYVSENVVSDEYWDEHQDLIREVTHVAYNLYTKSRDVVLDDGIKEKALSPKLCGRFIEGFFSVLIKNENSI